MVRRLWQSLVVLMAFLPSVLVTGPVHAATTVEFGARAGKTVAAYQSYESRVGHRVSNARLYYLWDDAFPNTTATWARDGGRKVFMSVRPKRLDGSVIPWADLASAAPGTTLYQEMRSWAQAIKNFAAPVYFTFNHEPEAWQSAANGDAVAYRGAWQKFITVLRAEGVSNAEYVFVGTSYGFKQGRVQPYYPGDAYVDAIGMDGYNWYTCRPGISNPWVTMQGLVDRMMPFANAHPAKPLMVVEFGTTEDPADPTRKAQWYSQAQALFKSAPYDRFVLVNEFDTSDRCAFRPDSSTTSLTAFRAWLNDPYYSG